jgi:hydroxyethylthiazole kinase
VTPPPSFAPISPAAVADTLAAVREKTPLVHCLTNIVVAQWTANVLLALGAAPAMVDNAHESGPFAAMADGVLINLGTPYDDTTAAMTAAVASAVQEHTPWVLDPVAVGPLAWRTEVAFRLLEVGTPAIIRGNASEILALAGGSGGRGVDSVDTPEAAMGAGQALAARYGTVVAVSGPVDHITDGERMVKVANGHPWMTRVTGVGCALGAMMAAFASRTNDPLLAAVAATATLTIAAEKAAETSRGPGSFAVALLDELSLLPPEGVAVKVRLS